MLFGEKLKMLRCNAGYTQSELGKLIGVSDRVLGYYETNERFPKKQETLLSLAKIFNVSMDYLLGLSNDEVEPLDTGYGTLTNEHSQYLLKNIETLFKGNAISQDEKDVLVKGILDIYFKYK